MTFADRPDRKHFAVHLNVGTSLALRWPVCCRVDPHAYRNRNRADLRVRTLSLLGRALHLHEAHAAEWHVPMWIINELGRPVSCRFYVTMIETLAGKEQTTLAVRARAPRTNQIARPLALKTSEGRSAAAPHDTKSVTDGEPRGGSRILDTGEPSIPGLPAISPLPSAVPRTTCRLAGGPRGQGPNDGANRSRQGG